MITAFAEGAATTGATGGLGEMLISLVMTFLPFILIFYFLILRPQRKQQKNLRNMLDALQVGDKVVTVGGVIGKIVKIKDDEVVIETGMGENKASLKFQKAAISTNLTVHE